MEALNILVLEQYPINDLYGSSIRSWCCKRGEHQVLSFKVINISEKVFRWEYIWRSSRIFNEVINNTLVVDGGLKKNI